LELLKPHVYKFFSIHLPTEKSTESIRVDERYRTLLAAFVNSGFAATYHVQGNGPHPDLQDILAHQDVIVYKPHSRAGNIEIQGRQEPHFLRGRIGCSRGLKQNVLLPNGDVLLCCMDYGMKHVLGNLVEMEMNALYQDKIFQEIQAGLLDDSMDILCRRCEQYAFPVGLKYKLLNKFLQARKN
jgi:radical SAM protein with 4Fe4S-binding SPASM domain